MTEGIKEVLERLSLWDEPLNFKSPAKVTNDHKAYLDYYGFNLDGIEIHFGKIDIEGTKILVQMFSPKKCKATVFLLHGYLDHVGSLRNIIHYLNKKMYKVISYDLQGHGLSGGSKASVNDFTDYVLTLEKVLQMTNPHLSGPYFLIGHSTGGAIAINYVLKKPDHPFKKLILVAPLIRSNHWCLTLLSFYLTKPIPFIEEIKRNFRRNSSDYKYLKFTKKDPLQPKVIPLDWVKALIHWNKVIKTYKPTYTNTLVIQGKKDKTVEWKYNLEFIKKKFHHLNVHIINNGRHALLNEKKRIRKVVFEKIYQFFELD